jgi:hypothetical protein
LDHRQPLHYSGKCITRRLGISTTISALCPAYFKNGLNAFYKLFLDLFSRADVCTEQALWIFRKELVNDRKELALSWILESLALRTDFLQVGMPLRIGHLLAA